MTVPSTARRAGPYNGNGVTTTFSFSFKTFAAADLQVTRTSATGIETVLVLNSHYSVSLNVDQDASPGGTITYPISGAALASGEKLTIVGNLAYEQTTDLLGGGAFNAKVIEDTFDRTVIQIQQLEERADRALALPVSAASVSTTLPVPVANNVIGWDSTAAALRNIDPATLATAVAYANWRTDVFSGTGSATQFTLTADPGNVNNMDVAIGGVVQTPTTDFTVSGTTLTFTSAPPAGTLNIVVRYGQAVPMGTADASMVTFLQAGLGAVVRTAQSKMRDVVSVKDFGAVGDGVADDTVAIQSAITYAKTLVAPRLILDNGTYLVSSTLSFDLPNNSTMEFLGTIRTATGNPAIRIGSSSANRVGYTVTGIKVERITTDTTNSSVGVQIRNVVASYIDIRRVTGFQDGVLCYADQGNGGISYNEIHLGFLHDNRYNLHLQAFGPGGYVNENVFVGGTFNHSSGYPAVSTINIWIDYATYRNNNNRFICPSLEDNSLLAVAAVINGDNNLILHPRMERIASQNTYEIQFTAVSSENQIIGAGFTMVPTNINDLGAGNCYETRQDMVIRKQTGAGEGLLRLRSTATSSARVWVAEDSGGTAKAYARGDGKIVSTTNGYFEGGIRYSTGSGTLEDRGLFVGSGSPNGVVTADPGSLYMNTAGGANTTLWVKESGGGNTGWVAK